MLNFDYLLSEDVTIKGKKIDDDKGGATSGSTANDSTQSGAAGTDTSTTTATKPDQPQGFGEPASNSNTSSSSDPGLVQSPGTSPGSEPGSTGTDTVGGGEDDEKFDYTTMKPDGEDEPPTGAGTGPDTPPGMGNDSPTGDEEPTDYTKMTPDGDEPPTGGDMDSGTQADNPTDSPGAGGDNPPEDEENFDYTSMTPDEGNDQNDTQNTPQGGGLPGTDNLGTGDPDAGITGTQNDGDNGSNPGESDGFGGGAAEEPATDYGELSPDNDNPDNAGAAGNGIPGNEGDPNAQTGTNSTEDPGSNDPNTEGNPEGNDQLQQMRDMESKLFADLSPEQIQLKDNELKTQFINLYEDIEKTINRVNGIVKTDANEEVVAFISKKLDELKDLTHKSLIDRYSTVTYTSNLMQYHQCLATYASIGKILEELGKKDKINQNIEKDTNLDTDVDNMISSLGDDTGA